jgi:hypothetical protein
MKSLGISTSVKTLWEGEYGTEFVEQNVDFGIG